MRKSQLRNELEAKDKCARETVHVAYERLKYLLTSSPGIIYSCRPSGDYGTTFISENIKTQLGYEAREFLQDSRFWVDRIHPENAPRILAELLRLFEQDYHTHEYRFVHKNGTYRWMHDKLKLVRDIEGSPTEIVGCRIDITEGKKGEEALKESENKYRTIFENTGTATAIINEDKIIELVNTEFEKLTGCSKKEIEGKKSWTEFVKQGDLERMKEYFRLIRVDPNAAPAQFEFGFIDRRGILKDTRISVAMIP